MNEAQVQAAVDAAVAAALVGMVPEPPVGEPPVGGGVPAAVLAYARNPAHVTRTLASSTTH
jgi:hypothetical protein